MGYKLPAADSPLRELFDVQDLVDMHQNRSWPTFGQCVANLRKTVDGCEWIRSAAGICIRADGQVWLIMVGPRGGWRKLWTFGKV